MARVTGVAALGLVKFIKRRLKEKNQNLGDFLLKLDREEDRQIFSKRILPTEWYPYPTFVNVLALVVKEFGGGDVLYSRRMGRTAADDDLRGVYKAFLKITPSKMLIKRFMNMWNSYYDVGKFELLDFGNGKAHIRLSEFPGVQRVHCLNVEGWMERFLELCGGKNIVVRQTQCGAQNGPYCLYEVDYENL